MPILPAMGNASMTGVEKMRKDSCHAGTTRASGRINLLGAIPERTSMMSMTPVKKRRFVTAPMGMAPKEEKATTDHHEHRVDAGWPERAIPNGSKDVEMAWMTGIA